MGLCIDFGYEVVSGTHRVDIANGSGIETLTVTAPTGKKPISGGQDVGTDPSATFEMIKASYPDGSTWVFKWLRDAVSQTVHGYVDVNYYVVFANT